MFLKKSHLLFLSLFFIFSTSYAQIPVNLTSSDLPILIINTNGKTIIEDVKVDGTLGIINNKTGTNKITDPRNEYDGNIGIEIRGNSSASWDNKPYAVELRNADGSNNNQAILGLPSENDWVLHPPWVDKTLMRNALVYDLFRELGWYAPRNAFCEVIVNNDYKGVYLLVEKLKVDKNRLPIADPDPNNVTGGYLLEMTTIERLTADEPYINCNISSKPLAIHSPKAEELTSAQRTYISDYVNAFESALYNKVYTGANGYRNYIDVPSFIDQMLVEEVIRELDIFCASTYFNKDMDGKLRMGPAWDFNRCMGNYSGASEYKTNDIWMTSTARGSCKVFWGSNLYNDPTFKAEFIERYKNLRTNLLSNANFNAKINAYMKILDQSRVRNYTRWDYALTTKYNQPQPTSCDTWEEEIDYVRNWLSTRLNWLDVEWNLTNHPIVTEIYADGTNTGKQWVELFNPFGSSISLNGWKLVFNDNEYIYSFPSTAYIGVNSYVVVCVDKASFSASNSGVSTANVYEGLNFKILNNNLKVAVLSPVATIMNEVSASVSTGWPAIEQSGNYSIGVTPYMSNNTEGHNWNWSAKAGGTPGAVNELFDYKGLVISEVVTSNGSIIADDFGEYEDWVEIYNSTDHAINLAGLFVSDNTSKPWKTKVPYSTSSSTLLNPNECAVFWADEDVEQGVFHADFKLSRDTVETVVLSYYDGFKYRTIDEVTVDTLLENQSFQRVSLDPASWSKSNDPTPYEYRITTSIPTVDYFDMKVKLFPNPAHEYFSVDIQLAQSSKIELKLYDMTGKQIKVIESLQAANAGHYTFTVNIADNIPSGIYLVEIKGDNVVSRQKIVIY